MISKNKSAHNYEYIDKYEAGIVLSGIEAKASFLGLLQINGSWVDLDGPFLMDSYIDAHPPEWVKYDPKRPRKLLLRKKELYKLRASLTEGLTVIPITAYVSDTRFIKVEIALARGLKKYDKREQLRKRDFQRFADE